jgi:cyclase
MDQDGKQNGFDLDLLRAVSAVVSIPVIASGGVGSLDHFVSGIRDGRSDAVLAASIFHFSTYSISQVKNHMLLNNIEVRL